MEEPRHREKAKATPFGDSERATPETGTWEGVRACFVGRHMSHGDDPGEMETAAVVGPAVAWPRGVRGGVSAFVGVFMAGICLYSAWQTVAVGHSGMVEHRKPTVRDLQRHRSILDEYRKEHGRDPTEEEWRGKVTGYSLVDGWGRPYRYEAADGDSEGRRRVTSLGRDGRPGGVGLDADLSTSDLIPERSRITLWQFLFELDSRELWAAALVSGALAGLLTYREFPTGRHRWYEPLPLIFLLIWWGLLTAFFTAVMATLEFIPTGH